MSSHGPGVVWFRRDLRLDDNPAWSAATAAHNEVIAVFVTEPALLDRAGELRRDQLVAHLHALDDELAERGAGLTVRAGPAATAIPRLLEAVEAAALYLNDDVTPFATRRDRAALAEGSGADSSSGGAGGARARSCAHHQGHAVAGLHPLLQTMDRHPPSLRGRNPDRVDRLPSPASRCRQLVIPPTSREAAARGRGSTAGSTGSTTIPKRGTSPPIDGTSELSADLKFGTIAARTVLDTVGTATKGRSAFVRQLAWRDWWAHTLAEHPSLPDRALRADYDRISWRADDEGFAAWAEGRTGFPIVDAGMRQLVATGWMHNRVRMITASFLVKDLLVDWRRGERFFRHHLIDADVAQNAGNWQWVAGTGPDAAPYFRVFNPTSQSKKFDPDGRYVRRWVPELADLPPETIHEPAAAGPIELAAAGVVLGDTYPAPIVDHAEARQRALETYKAALG